LKLLILIRPEDFLRISILSVWISVNELVIPGGMNVPSGGFFVHELANSRRNNNYSGGFLVYEVVIPKRITIHPVEGKCWLIADEISSGW
jgi:hypothetical protein